ncbi:VOC family protein [Nocardiopsis kunsanensis]|uniref:VOC family protein n=1 Tax=Nocardiopsis kunsanensis TaxID=141693 RepID=UPI0004770FC3|nr:VOC family protein [Nocardiopsis kunsanensis]
MDHRFSLLTLGVRDVARAADFYEAVGFERRHDLGTIVFLPTTGPALALYNWDDLAADTGLPADGTGFRGVTMAVNLDSPGEVDAMLARWTQAGARVVREPVEKGWGGYSGYAADPDGHLWEFAHNPSTAHMRITPGGRFELSRPRRQRS